MLYRCLTGAFALAATLTLSINGAQAFDETKFPNWKGQWVQLGGLQSPAWDPAKPSGTSQQAPLTPEYQAIFEASVKTEAAGGPAGDPTARCVSAGMPRVMMAIEPMSLFLAWRIAARGRGLSWIVVLAGVRADALAIVVGEFRI
jgi:hypothetical protein